MQLERDDERLDPSTHVLAVLARISKHGCQTLFTCTYRYRLNREQEQKRDLFLISERFRQFCFFTKRSTLLLEKSRKINFLHLFYIEQHAKLLPFLLMLVD